MINLTLLENLFKNNNTPFTRRIFAQLRFAAELSRAGQGGFDSIINPVIDYLQIEFIENGNLTKKSAEKAELMLLPLQEKAKEYTLLFAGHAHIDMNWMWRMDETVMITIETVKTMLRLMDEYPEFTFSQSQASIYKIIEDYAPELLPQIKRRIKEGRWEVTASAWVEADKNMTSGESMTRQVLYTKQYLSDLLEMDSAEFNLGFEPDTFGHSVNVPEILASVGIKYYYHCRGYDGHNIYKFRAPSGKELLVLREANWYNQAIDEDVVLYLPEFAKKNNIKTGLRVYGTGDHGGGPTRRDIEKIIEMQSWPVFPVIKFGSMREYFYLLEKLTDLPVVEKELNFIFDGCYTSQSRIKMANRIGEQKLYEAECLAVLSGSSEYRTDESVLIETNKPDLIENKKQVLMRTAWENLLFNQFHDILPGSGTVDTREHAMGKFQEVLAVANSSISRSLQEIVSDIDIENLVPKESFSTSTSYGAGVGFGSIDFSCPQTNRSEGLYRIYHLFNTLPYRRNDWVTISLWDWPGDLARLTITDYKGENIPFQIISGLTEPGNTHFYWQHTYTKILVQISVKSFGYNTIIISEQNVTRVEIPVSKEPIVSHPVDYILENEHIKVKFNSLSMALENFTVKKTGKNTITGNGACFHIIEEDSTKGMSAWNIGRYLSDQALINNCMVLGTNINSNFSMQWIKYKISFGASNIIVTVSLKKDSNMLDFEVECDWKEHSIPFVKVPQLCFAADLSYDNYESVYDVPMGTIVRQNANHDVPALSFACAINKEKTSPSLALFSKTKYGYRIFNGRLALSLIRSSYDPDPNPEIGKHSFQFSLCVAEPNPEYLVKKSREYNNPIISCSGTRKTGKNKPESGLLLDYECGNVCLGSVKKSENSEYTVLRFNELSGHKTQMEIPFLIPVKEAFRADSNENIIEPLVVEENVVFATIEPYSIITIMVKAD